MTTMTTATTAGMLVDAARTAVAAIRVVEGTLVQLLLFHGHQNLWLTNDFVTGHGGKDSRPQGFFRLSVFCRRTGSLIGARQ